MKKSKKLRTKTQPHLQVEFSNLHKIMKHKIDGNEQLKNALEKLNIDLLSLIAETSIWVSPEACKLIKRQYGSTTRNPNVRRGKKHEKKGDVINGIRIDDNTYANSAIKSTIGKNIRFDNFITCHIYPNTCYDERYHTKIENLVLIPNSIAQLSDNFEAVRNILQYRSFELYGWYPEEEIEPIKPINYPTNWKEPISVTIKESLNNQSIKANSDVDLNKSFDREKEEIKKIKRKLPLWMKSEGKQCNSIILFTFLDMLKDEEFVSRKKLMVECGAAIKDFNGNFNQMAQFGEKNHGKVFEVKGDNVYLWQPVAKFILDSYHKYKMEKES